MSSLGTFPIFCAAPSSPSQSWAEVVSSPSDPLRASPQPQLHLLVLATARRKGEADCFQRAGGGTSVFLFFTTLGRPLTPVLR